MKPTIFFLMVLTLWSFSSFADEGMDPDAVSAEYQQWEQEFKSSLASPEAVQTGSGASAPARPETPSARVNRPVGSVSAQSPQALKDRPALDGASKVERLENRVGQLERTVKSLEDRQEILDRMIDDLKRRR
ncbi:MAG: hypothetical protein FGM27_01810 [Candidatus Omnitrophica bacterium]|nr:hypothetical protein [Candidatus Omnitrophota bacterium]